MLDPVLSLAPFVVLSSNLTKQQTGKEHFGPKILQLLTFSHGRRPNSEFFVIVAGTLPTYRLRQKITPPSKAMATGMSGDIASRVLQFEKSAR